MKILALIIFLVLAAVDCADAHVISWTYAPAIVPAQGFRIYRKKANQAGYTLLATATAGARSYIDKDRTNGNCYFVTPYNAIGTKDPVPTICAVCR